MAVQDTIWTESHRPQTLDDITGHDTIVSMMADWVDDETMPHLIFAGPQGVGKTAMITAFAREKYGDDAWRNNVLELNASDERGIDVIRDKVKRFARQSTAVGTTGYKIIFLDEADSLTNDAQAAMRRVMEDFHDKTRFVLSCNYLNKIIQPIQSRCAVFRFGRLEDTQVKAVLERICDVEGVSYDEQHLWRIAENANGDMRAAVNTLQSCERDGEIVAENVDAMCTSVDRAFIEELVDEAMAGEFEAAMDKLDTELISEGVNPQSVTDVFLSVIREKDLPGDAKVKMLSKLAESDWRMLNGANPSIHFHSLLADIHIARHLTLDAYEKQVDDEDRRYYNG